MLKQVRTKIGKLLFGSYYRLAALSVGLAVLPLLCAMILAEISNYRQKTESVRKTFAELSSAINIQQGATFNSVLSVLEGLAQTQAVGAQDAARCQELFQYLPKMYSFIRSVALYTQEGSPAAYAAHASCVAQPLRQRLRNVAPEDLAGDKLLVVSARDADELLFILPLRGEYSQGEMFLVISVSLDYYMQLIRLLDPPVPFSVAMFGQDGAVLRLGPNTPGLLPVQAGAWLTDWLPSGTQGLAEIRDADGQGYLACYARQSLNSASAPYLSTVLLARHSDSFAPAYASARKSLLGLLLGTLGLLALVMSVCFLAFKRPIALLLSVSRRLGQDDFAAGREVAGLSWPFRAYGVALANMSESLEKSEQDLQRARQAVEAANQSKSEFLANMSHEIRTPMNIILGLPHLALKSGLNQAQLTCMSKLQAASRNLLHVIDDILDFSKLESGKIRLENARFGVHSLFSSIANNYRRQLEANNIQLQIEVEPGVPRYLWGDPLRLEQAIAHLADNAIRHTKNGTVRISCALASLLSNVCELRIVVADSGEGMHPDFLHRFFSALNSGNPSAAWGVRGLGQGLGLPIAYRLFSLMGGGISVSSEPGRGTVFTCTARFACCHFQQERDAKLLVGKRILLAGDTATLNLHLALLGSFSMRPQAVQIQAALGELQAAEAVGESYDFLLLDCCDSERDLNSLIRHIRDGMNLKKPPQILVISVLGHDERCKLAEEAEADIFLHKPVYGSVLIDALLDLSGEEASSTPGQVSQVSQIMPEQYGPQDFTGLRVLLVEDNIISRQYAQGLLQSAGAVVSTAENGSEALKILNAKEGEGSFDIVLMDLQMPNMDGFEAAWRIRNDSHLEAVFIPVIAMTAQRNSEAVEACHKSGMDGHIAKPIEAELFFSTLRRWLPIKPDAESVLATAVRELYSSLQLRQEGPALEVFFRVSSLLRRFVGSGRLEKLQRLLEAGDWDKGIAFLQYLQSKMYPRGGHAD